MPQPFLHFGNVGLVVKRVGAQAQAVLETAEADPDAFLETHPCGGFRETRFRETVLRDTEPHSTVVNDAVSGISQKRGFLGDIRLVD
jgi:hypothetical protein